MSERITFFLSTRDRPHILFNSLESIKKFSPESTILVGNASSKEFFEETSKVIKNYENAVEIPFAIDPGACIVYNKLHELIKTEFSIVWTDDVFLLKEVSDLLHFFDSDPNLLLVALPMIDDISEIESLESGTWKKDEHGCAMWVTSSGRCAHHSITRTEYFQKIGNVCGFGNNSDIIDNFFHNNTSETNRYWPNDGAYILHTRLNDNTRWNMVLNSSDNIYRFSPEERQRYNQK
jgi:hypothetical protein